MRHWYENDILVYFVGIALCGLSFSIGLAAIVLAGNR